MINTKLIWEKRNSLTSGVCKELISKFEIDPDKIPDIILNEQGDRMIKKSTALNISALESWKSLDSILFDYFNESIKGYIERLLKMNYFMPFNKSYEIKDSGYIIEKYDIPRDGEIQGIYSWHNDFFVEKIGTSILTIIVFLGDVKDGGEMEFIDGAKIKAETGKIVIFPSTWEMVYRINSPESNPLYICKGYLCVKYKEKADESQN
jgi:hypothetical protein